MDERNRRKILQLWRELLVLADNHERDTETFELGCQLISQVVCLMLSAKTVDKFITTRAILASIQIGINEHEKNL